jgi:hypothetical protein
MNFHVFFAIHVFLFSQSRDLVFGLSLLFMSMKNLHFIAMVLKNGSLIHVLFAEFSSPRAILCTCFYCIPGGMIRFAGRLASNVRFLCT